VLVRCGGGVRVQCALFLSHMVFATLTRAVSRSLRMVVCTALGVRSISFVRFGGFSPTGCIDLNRVVMCEHPLFAQLADIAALLHRPSSTQTSHRLHKGCELRKDGDWR
jgi:hypothetical protein